jgi:ribosomal protein S18 acetylase RimI-like enzyme
MIEVFKTNVNSKEQAKKITELMVKKYPALSLNFDLTDCDRILRVQSDCLKSSEIINQIKSLGYFCEILEDNDNKFLVRKITSNEGIPYNLLLLADETKEAIDKYIHDCEIYVYEQYDNIIAVYALKIIDIKTAEIKNIAVEMGFQGKGIGTDLIKHAEEQLTKRGFQTLLIGTADVPSKQLKLYKKLGFENHRIIENFFTINYPKPIFEDGIQLKNMIVLKKELSTNTEINEKPHILHYNTNYQAKRC